MMQIGHVYGRFVSTRSPFCCDDGMSAELSDRASAGNLIGRIHVGRILSHRPRTAPLQLLALVLFLRTQPRVFPLFSRRH